MIGVAYIHIMHFIACYQPETSTRILTSRMKTRNNFVYKKNSRRMGTSVDNELTSPTTCALSHYNLREHV